MAKDKVDTSQFDRRIQIQKLPGVSSISWDAQGGYNRDADWTTIYSCWADKQDFPHGRYLLRKYMFQQLFPQATTTFEIRFQKSVPLDASMRVLFIDHGVNHYYKIIGVQNPMSANVSLFLVCQEDQAQAVN